jgi:cardiolipin synthase
MLRHLPNILTGLRLIAAPALAVLLLRTMYDAALGVFVFAGVSDVADGFLAKRFQLATRFGRYLDPTADKLLMTICFVTLSWLGIASLWLTILVIARDVAIILGIVLAKRLALPLRVAPIAAGKFSTFVQVSYIGLMLLFLALGAHWPMLATAAAVACGAATAYSWLAYGQLWLKALAQKRRKPA